MSGKNKKNISLNFLLTDSIIIAILEKVIIHLYCAHVRNVFALELISFVFHRRYSE